MSIYINDSGLKVIKPLDKNQKLLFKRVSRYKSTLMNSNSGKYKTLTRVFNKLSKISLNTWAVVKSNKKLHTITFAGIDSRLDNAVITVKLVDLNGQITLFHL